VASLSQGVEQPLAFDLSAWIFSYQISQLPAARRCIGRKIEQVGQAAVVGEDLSAFVEDERGIRQVLPGHGTQMIKAVG